MRDPRHAALAACVATVSVIGAGYGFVQILSSSAQLPTRSPAQTGSKPTDTALFYTTRENDVSTVKRLAFADGVPAPGSETMAVITAGTPKATVPAAATVNAAEPAQAGQSAPEAATAATRARSAAAPQVNPVAPKTIAAAPAAAAPTAAPAAAATEAKDTVVQSVEYSAADAIVARMSGGEPAASAGEARTSAPDATVAATAAAPSWQAPSSLGAQAVAALEDGEAGKSAPIPAAFDRRIPSIELELPRQRGPSRVPLPVDLDTASTRNHKLLIGQVPNGVSFTRGQQAGLGLWQMRVADFQASQIVVEPAAPASFQLTFMLLDQSGVVVNGLDISFKQTGAAPNPGGRSPAQPAGHKATSGPKGSGAVPVHVPEKEKRAPRITAVPKKAKPTRTAVLERPISPAKPMLLGGPPRVSGKPMPPLSSDW